LKRCNDLKFIENQIFNEIKDSKDNYIYLIKKYEGLDIDFKNLHKNILSYQYKTYGNTIRNIEKTKEEERRKRRENCKNR